jgi:glycerophosphoryl diester phosphodiesterase
VTTIIGHRGAPGYRPEHTMTSYGLAIAMGVDAVEPDLVMTSDGVAVVRHDPVDHLTLAELKAAQPEVLTFDELLLLLAGQGVGLHVELKDATRLAGLGLHLEDAALASLRDHGLDGRSSGVHLQSFEPSCLRRLRAVTDLRLVQLVDRAGAPADLVAQGDPTTYHDLASPRGLRQVATYADAVGLHKSRLLDGAETAAARVDIAHLLGLRVLAFTVGRRTDELVALLDAGVDGVFCDYPDVARAARDTWRLARVG